MKAVKEGLDLPNLPHLHSLPQDFIDEALVLSDILNINEMSAVELLLAGEQQLPRSVGKGFHMYVMLKSKWSPLSYH